MVPIAAADPAHVPEQVVVAGVRRHREVHGHRGEEGADIGLVDAERADRVHHCGQHRVVTAARPEVAEEALAPVRQGQGALRRAQAVVQVIHDLVGVPGEAVERMDVRPLPVRQQPGRQVVRGAVPAVQLAAALIGGGQGGQAWGGRQGGQAWRGGRGPGLTRSWSGPALRAWASLLEVLRSQVRAGWAGPGRPRHPGRPPLLVRCLAQLGHRGPSRTARAASRPEISTMGTPIPGAVPAPAKCSPGTRRADRRGRSHAVCERR